MVANTDIHRFLDLAAGADAPTADSSRESIRVDEAEFRRFYERTAGNLRSYITLTCRDRDLADDLLQECFYRLVRARLPELNEFQVRSYLYKTAGSLVADHSRAARRERGWRDKTVLRSSRTGGVSMSRDMMRAFSDLKPQQQSLLWLAYVEGFNHREIAESLDMKEASVRVVLSRARAKLAAILTERGLAPMERS